MTARNILMAAAGASTDANYVEDVFSTWLYTGTGSGQTINNGIDLAGKGGLVWIKQRSGSQDNTIFDTARGVNNYLRSDSLGVQNPGGTYTDLLTAFNATGFSLGADASTAGFVNGSASTYTSWTFRKQPKFFDVVTYTGNGANRTIAHNLGSVPGCIIVKRTDTTADWQVYHRSLTSAANSIQLNLTNAQAAATTVWNSTAPTSTVFSLGTDATVNASGGTYVAYIYAHDAGGFGLTGTDNVISCGSFTTDGSGNASVNLGYEPQWIMTKCASDPGFGTNWSILDTMRGWTANGPSAGNVQRNLIPNLSNAESTNNQFQPNATGFTVTGSFASSTIIYIAIRRGPMKVPTTGTSVFGLNARTGTGANATVTGSAGVSDAVLIKNRGAVVGDLFASRLTGTGYMETSSTAAEVVAGTTILQANPWDVMDGVKVGTTSTITNAASANTYINYLFDRAPGFFDVVCYTGNSIDNRSVAHNLTVAPELIIVKGRDFTSGANSWIVGTNFTVSNYRYGRLESPGTVSLSTYNLYFNAQPTASVFTLYGTTASYQDVNEAGVRYVAYLFATCPGVSKVGTYVGTGTTQTINCGFTAGARFVLIKRTTGGTGDWYVWDTARGIVAGNDPYLLLNSIDAEVTGTDYIDTFSAGFEISSTAPAAINASGVTFIFLAIA